MYLTTYALECILGVSWTGSRHANMKELRFDADGGVWRVAFAFDPKRRGVLLVAGDKSGGSEKRFYRSLLQAADARFDAHLARLKKEDRRLSLGGGSKGSPA